MHRVYGRSLACDALQKVAVQHPDQREQVIGILSAVLRDAEHEDEIVCTGALGPLMGRKAIEALLLVRQTFELGWIDKTIYGAWDTVLRAFGIEPDADDPLVGVSQQCFAARRKRCFPASSARSFRWRCHTICARQCHDHAHSVSVSMPNSDKEV